MEALPVFVPRGRQSDQHRHWSSASSTGLSRAWLIAPVVAYPSSPPELSAAIRDAVKQVNATSGSPSFKLWEHGDTAGRPLTQPIIDSIEQADVLVADVTRLNVNVAYEAGYAIGFQRRVLLIKCSALTADNALVLKTGIFDTLGYEPYSASPDLARILEQTPELIPLKTDAAIDTKAPVYLLETPVRTPDMTRIVARVKRARLFYRSFTPSEDARLSAMDAIRHVSRSIGVDCAASFTGIR